MKDLENYNIDGDDNGDYDKIDDRDSTLEKNIEDIRVFLQVSKKIYITPLTTP